MKVCSPAPIIPCKACFQTSTPPHHPLQVKIIVVLGELGGQDEYGVVEAMKAGAISKPVVAWVSGTCATLFKSEVQFGHAGARSGGDTESAQVCVGWLVVRPTVLGGVHR